MLATIIPVAGWAFWVVIVLAFVAVTLALSAPDDDFRGVAAVMGAAAFAAVLMLSDAFAGWTWPRLVLAMVAYLVIGCAWATWQWWSFLHSERARLYANWEAQHTDANVPKSWAEWSKDRRPSAADNKAKIVAWIELWPWSATWAVLKWPRKIAAWCYEKMAAAFDRMAAHVFDGAGQ